WRNESGVRDRHDHVSLHQWTRAELRHHRELRRLRWTEHRARYRFGRGRHGPRHGLGARLDAGRGEPFRSRSAANGFGVGHGQRYGVAMRTISRWMLAAALLVLSSLAHGQNCQFNGSGGTITFASLDPSVANTRTGFIDLKVKCNPAGFTPTWQFSGTN